MPGLATEHASRYHGYFLVHRKIFLRRDWPQLIWLIGNANWAAGTVDGIELGPGEFCWSERFIARAWTLGGLGEWSRWRVRRYLQKLVTEGTLSKRTTHRTTRRTIYRLEKYATYQEPHTPKRTTHRTKPKERRKEKKKDALSHVYQNPRFCEFWSLYPKKRAKKDTATAWIQTAGDRPPLPALLDILRRHIAQEDWGKDEGKFIPYPATWLRQHRWEDQIGQGDEIEWKPVNENLVLE